MSRTQSQLLTDVQHYTGQRDRMRAAGDRPAVESCDRLLHDTMVELARGPGVRELNWIRLYEGRATAAEYDEAAQAIRRATAEELEHARGVLAMVTRGRRMSAHFAEFPNLLNRGEYR